MQNSDIGKDNFNIIIQGLLTNDSGSIKIVKKNWLQGVLKLYCNNLQVQSTLSKSMEKLLYHKLNNDYQKSFSF